MIKIVTCNSFHVTLVLILAALWQEGHQRYNTVSYSACTPYRYASLEHQNTVVVPAPTRNNFTVTDPTQKVNQRIGLREVKMFFV
jgi:hypothetical protein